MINNGFTPNKDDYEFCTKVENMIIPTEGFFGISAATGGLAGTIFLLKPLITVHLVLSA